jgi:drug/metabolite transporter (DMT)-like permease
MWLTVLLSLGSGLLVGAGDWFGGRASRTASPVIVTFIAQIVITVGTSAIAVVAGTDGLRSVDLLLGAIGGVGVAGAYVIFFWLLAQARAALVTPVTALSTALTGFVADLIVGGISGWLIVIGLVLAIAAVPLLAWSGDGPTTSSQPVLVTFGWAVLSGAGFGSWFIVTSYTEEASGLWPPVATSACASVLLGLVLLVRRQPPQWSRDAAIAGAIAAITSATITIALRRGPQSVATVLGSLYPISTVAVAARIDGERVRWWHLVGLVLALLGVVLIIA